MGKAIRRLSILPNLFFIDYTLALRKIYGIKLSLWCCAFDDRISLVGRRDNARHLCTVAVDVGI